MFAHKRTSVVLIGVLVLAGASLAVITYMRQPRPTPAQRGRQVAESFGCFACHGPGGTGGMPNPGSEEQQVPAWDGGTSMMYVENEQEIREWILDGHPKRLEKEHHHEETAENDGSLPIHMPAFEGVVSADEVNDLVAYYKAVAAFASPPANAREGYDVASRLGCFGCHGPGGRVGANNPRSFKGYIPPWHGADFNELVKNDEELRSWILDGGIERLESNPLARRFTGRQVIHMPAYRSTLREGELDALVSYIQWLNREKEDE